MTRRTVVDTARSRQRWPTVGRTHGTKKKNDRRRAAAGCFHVGNARLMAYEAKIEVECVAEADPASYGGAVKKFGCREDSTVMVSRRRRL